MHSETFLAYVAGFFDGEGNYAALMSVSGLVYKAGIGQVYVPVLEEIQAAFGGSLRLNTQRGSTIQKKPFARLEMNGQYAYGFVTAVKPYLRVKAKDAEMFLKIWEVRRDWEARAQHIDMWKNRNAA